jgi:hypothetical protein
MSVSNKKETSLRDIPPTLKISELEEAEYAFAHMSARVPAGVDFAEVIKPGFWMNVVSTFKKNQMANSPDKAGATIAVRTEDHAYYALLYVRAVLEGGLIVQCIGPSYDKSGKPCPIDLQTGAPWGGEKPQVSEYFEMKWNKGKNGFDIVRKSDNQVIGDGAAFKTRESAMEFITKMTKA